MNEKVSLTITVNGTPHSAEVEPRLLLADFIRENLDLTGTHVGCEHGICGACTILMNGDSVRSCLTLAVQADGAEIITIEGLADGDEMHPVQRAMKEAMAFQCAFCAPGFLMSTVALLEENPHPSAEEICKELSGNLCRCTGYQSIIAGVETAVGLLSATAEPGAEQ